MGFSKQGYWSGLPFPSPGDLPDPRTETMSLFVSFIGRWILYYSLVNVSHSMMWGLSPMSFSCNLDCSPYCVIKPFGYQCSTLSRAGTVCLLLNYKFPLCSFASWNFFFFSCWAKCAFNFYLLNFYLTSLLYFRRISTWSGLL